MRNKPTIYVPILLGASLVSGCGIESPHGAASLMMEPVTSTSPLETKDLQSVVNGLGASNTSSQEILQAFQKRFYVADAKNSAFSVEENRMDDKKTLHLVLIYDGIPSDDSVKGYRYDLKIEAGYGTTWKVVDAQGSWRCWKDRGHKEFSATPCL